MGSDVDPSSIPTPVWLALGGAFTLLVQRGIPAIWQARKDEVTRLQERLRTSEEAVTRREEILAGKDKLLRRYELSLVALQTYMQAKMPTEAQQWEPELPTAVREVVVAARKDPFEYLKDWGPNAKTPVPEK